MGKSKWKKVKKEKPLKKGQYLMIDVNGELDIAKWTSSDINSRDWDYFYKKWCKIPK